MTKTDDEPTREELLDILSELSTLTLLTRAENNHHDYRTGFNDSRLDVMNILAKLNKNKEEVKDSNEDD